MMREFDDLIDQLADDVTAINPVRIGMARTILAIGSALAIAYVVFNRGARSDVLALSPPPMLAISVGLFAVMALAAGNSAIRMAYPQVGASHGGPLWALAAVLIMPVVAVLSLASDHTLTSGLEIHQGIRCLTTGLSAGTGTFVFLVIWLKQRAPVAPVRAAWFAGLAAGAVGAIANSLECPVDAITHLGIWHVSEVIVGGLIGRLILPPLVRW